MARLALLKKMSGFMLVGGLVLATTGAVWAEAIAVGASIATQENIPVSGTLTVNDAGDAPYFAIAATPGKGSVTLDQTTGAFIYTPAPGSIGSDSFSFTASVGGLTSEPAVMTVAIRPDVEPGDILVSNGGVDGVDTAVVLVDPVTGQQGIVSSGGLLTDLRGIALEPAGTILVIDGNNGIVRIDPVDGAQSLVSAGTFTTPLGLAVEADGNILVASFSGLIRLSPVTGEVLRIFPAGTYFDFPGAVAVEPDGRILVADIGFFADTPSQIVAVDPESGAQTLISDGGQLEDGEWEFYQGIARARSGAIFVTDGLILSNVIGVDPDSGQQRLVTADGQIATPGGIGIAGTSLVVASSTGAVIKIDAETGMQQVLSSGGHLVKPVGLAVVNHPPAITAIADVYALPGATVGPIPFSVTDLETEVDELTLRVSSSNQSVLPLNKIHVAGSGSERTITLVADIGVSGTSKVALSLGDGLATTTRTFMVAVDGVSPTSGSVSINDGAAVTASEAVTLSLSASDDMGVTAYYLSADSVAPAADADGWAPVVASTSYSGSVPYSLAPGSGTKSVRAWFRDGAGNVSAMAADDILLDSSAPAGSVSINGGAAVTAGEAVTLSLSASDDMGVTAYYLSADSVAPAADAPGWAPVAATTSYSGSVPYTLAAGSGTKSVHVWFRDGVGNVSSMAADDIAIEEGGPVFSGIQPADESWAEAADIVLVGAVTDPDGGSVTLSVNGIPVPVAVGGAFSQAITLSNGANPIELVATDASGNESRERIIINLDAIIPYLELSTLPDGSHTDQDTLNISGVVRDREGAQSVLVGGEPVTVRPDGSFAATVPLLPGENIIEITVVDTVGNQTTVTRTVIRDVSAPAVAVARPTDAEHTARPILDVSGSAGDETIVTITDTLGNSVTVVRDGGSFSGTVHLVEGLNTILITATDPATGLSNSVKRTVLYDPHAPGLTLTSPPSDITIRNGSTVLAGVVSDALTEVTVTVSADGATFTPAVNGDGTFSQSISFAEEGIYPVVVTVRDQNGASTEVQRTIIYSRGLVVIARGAASTGLTTVFVDLDYYPSATRMQFLLDGRAWTALEPFAATKKLTLPAGDGQKRVTVRFLDGAGNATAYYSDTIALDMRYPKGALAINGGDAVTALADVTLSLAVSDANGDVRMQFSDNGSTWPTTWLPFTPSTEYRLSASDTYGTKRVYVRFRDGAGKVSPAVYDTIKFAATIPPVTEGRIVLKNGDTYTTTAAVMATVITPPTDGSYAQMAVSTTGTAWAWESIKDFRSVTLPPGDGVKTVYVKFRTADPLEESPVYSDTIILDTRPPTGSIQINGGAYTTNRPADAVVSLAASDLNGVTSMQFSTNGTTWPTDWEPFASSRIFPLTGEGTRKVVVRFKDAAGKISTAYSDTILVDALPPKGNVTINGGAASTTMATVTLSFNSAGARYLQLSLDDGTVWGAWEPYVGSKKVTLPWSGPMGGTARVKARFRDYAGNTSVEYQDDIVMKVKGL